MFALKLKTQITLVMVVVMSIIVIVLSAILGSSFSRNYNELFRAKGLVIVKLLKNEITKASSKGLSLSSMTGLNEMCKEIVKNYEDIGYALVTDDKGKILYHNVEAEIANNRDSRWQKHVTGSSGQGNLIQKMSIFGGSFYDISLPLEGLDGKPAGFVSVGMDANALSDRLRDIYPNMLLIIIISLVLVAIVAFFFGRKVVLPLEKLIERITELGNGDIDFSKGLDITSNDEIGELAESFNNYTKNVQRKIVKSMESIDIFMGISRKIAANMERVSAGVEQQYLAAETTSSSIEEMNSSFGEIAGNIENLSSTTEEASSSILEMAASIVEVAGIAENVSESVDDTSSSIEEMTISIKEIASIAEDLAASADKTVASIEEINASIEEVDRFSKASSEVAEETSEHAEKGMVAVEKTIGGMNQIKFSVDESGKVIETLKQKSENIGEILTVIDEVAEQTNLLALNAAIIAAQAGEHGKSFAVVAEEIKDLSERTAMSTKEISTLIGALQSESTNAAKAMDQASKNVVIGVELSQEAGVSLEKILWSASKSKDMTNKIASATLEQSKGSNQVKEAMENVNQLITRVARATHEQSIGSEMIIQATESMRDATGHIQRATQEQSKGGKQITHAIENITNMTISVNIATREQSTGVGYIVESIENIKKLYEEYGTVINEMNETVNALVAQTEILNTEIKDN